MAADLGTIRGSVSLDIRKAVASYAALRAQNARTVYALRGTGDAFISSGKTMGVAGGAMVYAFGRVVKAAAEFERKMDFFSAVTDTNSAKMQKLSKFTLQLAQDTIYSAGEIADGIIELGKAGVSADQIMRGVGEAMANLGAAGDIPLAQSGQIITSTMQQFDLAAQDTIRITDLLAGAANASIADIDDLGVSLKYVGGVAHTAGLKFDDTLTAISLLAKAGIRGSTAGTSLRQMIVSFGGATAPATEALEELGIITEKGTNRFYDQEGNLKSLSEVFEILGNATEDLTAKQRVQLMRTIFNNRALSAAAILSREGAKGFDKMNSAMKKTTAADVAHERLDNLSGDLEILQGNIETLMIQAGTPFQDELRKWVQGITKLVQAFGKLDPKMQENIVRSIGVGGAALIAMGAFNIIIGTIFKFAAHLLKMGAALKFVGRLIKIVVTNGKWFVALFGTEIIAAIAGFLAAAGLVIAIVLAVAAIFIVAYKKIEPFRNLVNKLAGAWKKGFDELVKIAKTALKDPEKAWQMYKAAVKRNLDAVVTFAKNLKGRLGNALKSAASAGGSFVTGIVNWFKQLPGRVLGAIMAFMGRLREIFTMKNIRNAVGTALGAIVKFFALLPFRIWGFMAKLVAGVLKFFLQLAPKAAYAVGFMVGKVVGFFIRLHLRVLNLARNIIEAVIKWFQKLPERAAELFSRLVSKVVSAFVKLKTEGPRVAADVVTGIIKFFQELPGKAATWFTQTATKVVNTLQQIPGKARQAASQIVSGFIGQVRDMPSTVSGILQDVIDAFTGVINQAYEAAKNVGGRLWQGFKDGIGMSSPSYIERAMWQITGTLDTETKKLRKHTMKVQKMSKDLAKTQLNVGYSTPQTAAKYRALATDHAANQRRARTLLAASSERRARRAGPTRRSPSGGGEVPFRITNWKQGRGYMYDIAQDAMDDNDEYDDSLGRMG